MKAAHLSEHITQLAAQHNVNVILKDAYGGKAWRKVRRIRIAPVKSAVTYAVALHEMGHVVGRNPKHRIDQEVEAWKWAMDNCLVWTDTMNAKMVKCLESYVWRTERRGSMAKPTEGHDVFTLIPRK